MGKYQVTQKEYEEIIETNPSHFKGPNVPAESVTWFDAIEYCNKRSRKEGLNPVYTISGTGNIRSVIWDRNANGYRLPTEAEWEYACRGGTTTLFNTGNNITSDQANYAGTFPYNNNAVGIYREKTTDVGSFAPNVWGLYDMHGNVKEWCWDRWGSYLYAEQIDPAGAGGGPYRVTRGGSYINDWRSQRSAKRGMAYPYDQASSIGFRLARNA
jgi:formylglycine-generating enzyme required for sulfatase activity